MKQVLLFFILLGLLTWPQFAAADEAIKVNDQNWDANFREHLTFTLQTESSAQITEVSLLYQVAGQLATSRNEAEFTPGTSVEAEFVIDQTKPENYMPPGTELQYWWKIVDEAGHELRTEKQTVLYLDNRYEWQTLKNERVTLYWYEGDDSFGQALFDRANVALDTLASDIGITLTDPIKVFIYADHADLLGALSASVQEWTGGQAFTTFGVVAIGVEPRELEWGLRAMTHEMSHLVIHQATDNPYRGLPRWLDEGIAVYNEDPKELVSDFKPILDQAIETDQLLSLRSLASPFPADPMQANLAYGQSGAVVKFIIDEYGSQAMANLLAIFAEGALDDEALQSALGVDTDTLDNNFRQSVGLAPLPYSGSNEATSEEEIQPIPVTPPAESASQPVEQVTPAQSSESQAETKPVEAPAQPAPESPAKRLPIGLPCLGGLLPILMGALWLNFKRT